MKLIEADKVEQAIKDYWKAYVDRMPTPYSTEEFEKFANRTAMCFEHRDELLKEIKALPSAQPEIIRCKDCINYIDHRCTVADHHVAPFSCCQSVFGAKMKAGGKNDR